MKKVPFLILSLVLCVTTYSASAWAFPKPQRMDEAKLAEQRYETALKESFKRAQKLAKKTGNKSLELTVSAGDFLISKKNRNIPLDKALEATQIQPANLLANLIYADLLSRQNNHPAADTEYRLFLQSLQKPEDSKLRDSLFKINDILPILTHIDAQLKAHGEKSFEPKIFYNQLLKNNFQLQLKWLLENIIPYGLAVLILLGIPFFLFRKMTDTESSIPTERMFLQIYWTLIGGYVLWAAHTFLNLPTLFDPVELEIVLFILIGSALAVWWRIQIHTAEKKSEMNDPNIQPCPHCGKTTLKLVTVCPFCNKKI